MIIINAKLKVSEEHREAYLDLMTNLVKRASEDKEIHFIATMKM